MVGFSATNLPEKVGGARVVLRDARGGFVGAGAWKIPALSSALHVEMQAVLHAVRLASQLGYHPVHLENDSSQAISIITTCVCGGYTMDLLAGDVLYSAACVLLVSLFSFRVKNNGIAHRLARLALSVALNLVWFE